MLCRAGAAGSIELTSASSGAVLLNGVNVQMGNGRRGLPGGARPMSKWALEGTDSDSDTDADAEGDMMINKLPFRVSK